MSWRGHFAAPRRVQHLVRADPELPAPHLLGPMLLRSRDPALDALVQRPLWCPIQKILAETHGHRDERHSQPASHPTRLLELMLAGAMHDELPGELRSPAR